jgi:hypothetical protein
MNFNLLRGLVEAGLNPEYRTVNPSRRATNSWILDIDSLILENDAAAYTKIESGRITPFFSKGANRNINSYFPGTKESVELGRKSVVTATGRKYTALYNANTAAAADGGNFAGGGASTVNDLASVEVIPADLPANATPDNYQVAYINPSFVQTVRLREKINIEIERKKIVIQRVTVVFKKEVNYSVDILVAEEELASTIASLLFGKLGAVRPR